LYLERRLNEREGVLLKYFTSFYDKIHVLLAKNIPYPALTCNITNRFPVCRSKKQALTALLAKMPINNSE
jgi:hypothetical protein